MYKNDESAAHASRTTEFELVSLARIDWTEFFSSALEPARFRHDPSFANPSTIR
jgi:hypothetical protein